MRKGLVNLGGESHGKRLSHIYPRDFQPLLVADKLAAMASPNCA